MKNCSYDSCRWVSYQTKRSSESWGFSQWARLQLQNENEWRTGKMPNKRQTAKNKPDIWGSDSAVQHKNQYTIFIMWGDGWQLWLLMNLYWNTQGWTDVNLDAVRPRKTQQKGWGSGPNSPLSRAGMQIIFWKLDKQRRHLQGGSLPYITSCMRLSKLKEHYHKRKRAKNQITDPST